MTWSYRELVCSESCDDALWSNKGFRQGPGEGNLVQTLWMQITQVDSHPWLTDYGSYLVVCGFTIV
jgi:hypothetical protein